MSNVYVCLFDLYASQKSELRSISVLCMWVWGLAPLDASFRGAIAPLVPPPLVPKRHRNTRGSLEELEKAWEHSPCGLVSPLQ